MVWNIAGSVKFRLSNTGAQNAVTSGVFFDAPGVVDNPPPPTFLAATSGGGRVNLVWQGVGQGTSYNIKRSTTNGGTYTQIASGVLDTTYADTTVTNGTTYYYIVTAVNPKGEGISSNQASATPIAPIGATAAFVRTDTTTQGTWKNVYGTQGFNVIGDTVNTPSYATVTASGNNAYTWLDATSDTRALQYANSANRLAACWYNSGTFSVTVTLTPGTTRNIALYCLDWDSSGRTMRIEARDANTNALLNQQNVSAFQNGKYLVWRISGAVKFNLINTGPQNSVLSGVFFDP
jgi:hypothetical protein